MPKSGNIYIFIYPNLLDEVFNCNDDNDGDVDDYFA
jgi:hypothetical protein